MRLLAQAIFDESLRHDIRGVDFDMFADIIAQSKTSVAEESFQQRGPQKQTQVGIGRSGTGGMTGRSLLCRPENPLT